MNRKLVITCIICTLYSLYAAAQEHVAPLDHNAAKDVSKSSSKSYKKTTALSLPFFEDFTGYGIFPDPARWIGNTTYVNNTMGFQPVSRGVVTFDALNAKGGPYDSSTMNALVYADSLTSQPIALAGHVASDSIYLSFFFQPQGNGFAPEDQDSLMLYFKQSNGDWTKVWAQQGITVTAFRQVMVPVTNTVYFHDDFQFRFVNKASINLNDDVWNVDYIRMNTGRNLYDTAINDIATTTDPPFLLNDYTSMPYRQFTANAAAELFTQHNFTVRNNYTAAKAVNYGYTAVEAQSGTPLFTSGISNANIPAVTEQAFVFPMYNASYSAPSPNSKVVFEQKYYTTTGAEQKNNDTIVKDQVFDNYLAYDDGTAEKSYFLKQFATLPAKVALEFHLNQPDTLRGVAIYFGRQVPLATNKFFNVEVYKDIAVNGGTDQMLYEEQLLFPGYADTINHFWIYRFTDPVVMNAGTFFLSVMQPAISGSDSLYYGLDVNRISANHLYFNVNNFWEPSLVSGAVMIRPMLGQKIIGTKVEDVNLQAINWSISPNPATDVINISVAESAQNIRYEITDMQGRTIQAGYLPIDRHINIQSLGSGMYLIRISTPNKTSTPQKIIKY